jgi:uncharacterized protein (DUF2132 family)
MTVLTVLVEYYGWDELFDMIPLRCFYHEPSISSSLKFLRHNLWAREKVEEQYLNLMYELEKGR